jgi:hypothetical protein
VKRVEERWANKRWEQESESERTGPLVGRHVPDSGLDDDINGTTFSFYLLRRALIPGG